MSTQYFDGKALAATLTGRCGVYRMLDGDGVVIYVGKARNLNKRVASYFGSSARLAPKVRAMVAQIHSIEVTVTRTEDEALILESNLIKELKPRYNIVLRDDKSYPYVYLSGDQEFPRLSLHRGGRSGKGRYFGPYPSAGAVRASLKLLQRLFLLRSCRDSFFRNRTRPCLQHQIKRCSAPCVGLIDTEAYRADVDHAVLFLEGRSQEVIEDLLARMQEASAALEFERAARYRDQINQLQRVQQRQYISSGSGDIDIVVCVTRGDLGCVQVFLVRGGHNLGNRTFFPSNVAEAAPSAILSAFLAQYYLGGGAEGRVPAEILTNHPLPDASLLSEALNKQAGKRIAIHPITRGDKARWLELAVQNAELALAQRQSAKTTQSLRLNVLQQALGLDDPIERIECFDVSHTQGEATVASCVVFGPEGAIKSDYRRFNIAGVEPGDDYAAMHQALSRRYTRIQREESELPDLLLVDGGKGQVTQAREVLESLQISEVYVIGVAKGPSRKPGLETLLAWDRDRPLALGPDDPAFQLLLQIRNEAHRFAITGHRQRRAKARGRSALEQIEGVGAMRRRQLIQYFGGLRGVSRAGVEDLSKVPGISKQLATKIYNRFHDTP